MTNKEKKNAVKVFRSFAKHLIENSRHKSIPMLFSNRFSGEIESVLQSNNFEEDIFITLEFLCRMADLLGDIEKIRLKDALNELEELIFSTKFHKLCNVETVQGSNEAFLAITDTTPT